MTDFSKQDNWPDVPEYGAKPLSWKRLREAPDRYAFQTVVGSQVWKIRLNDFPDEPLYTLVVDGREIIHFNEWPMEWRK